MSKLIELARNDAAGIFYQELQAQTFYKNKLKVVRTGNTLVVGESTISFGSLAEIAANLTWDAHLPPEAINDGFILEYDAINNEVVLFSEPFSENIASENGSRAVYPRYGGEIRGHESLRYSRQLEIARQISCLYIQGLVSQLPGNPKLLYTITNEKSNASEFLFEFQDDEYEF